MNEGRDHMPSISVIASTYNHPKELWGVLRSLSRQTADDFETIVADDGSGEETANVVKEWQRQWKGPPLLHVWHEDKGFRLAEIRNRAIAASHGDYIVFLDGDCIAPLDFVRRHAFLAEAGWMVCGHRLMLGKEFTETVLRDQLPIEEWRMRQWLGKLRRGAIDRLQPMFRLPGVTWRRFTARGRPHKVRGCNMAAWRNDLVKIDGFDSELVGWGHEDYDVASRLEMIGIKLKDGRWATGVYHLWHPLADRTKEDEHWDWIVQMKKAGRVTARRGLSALQS
jgi:glycosyltransferase involved in cell wall biosynthesis